MKKIINIVKLPFFSGNKVEVCSIKIKGSDKTEFEELLEFNKDTYKETINDIFKRLYIISKELGIQPDYFDKKTDPDIYALSNTDNLRIFCIIKNNRIIILGGGGSKLTKAYKDDPNLDEPFRELKIISKSIDNTFTGTPSMELLEQISMEIEV